MAPPKKKSSERKRVLALEPVQTPAVSLWQAKYQQLLASESTNLQNGTSDGISSTTNENPLSGLVGNYASDSDSDHETVVSSKVDDFLKEIEETTSELPIADEPVASTSSLQRKPNDVQYQVQGCPWTQCFDQNTGYPYYWNQLTNEVSWQPPAQLLAAIRQMHKTAPPVASEDLTSKKSKAVTPNTDSKKKYPWEGNSDSEDEKIELITSFGPTSGDESEVEPPKKVRNVAPIKPKMKQRSNQEKQAAVVGPQLPPGMSLDVINGDDGGEAYETSSLMTPLAEDVGPPGVEFASSSTANDPPDSSEKESESELALLKEKLKILEKLKEIENSEMESNDADNSDDDDDEDILTKLKRAKLLNESKVNSVESKPSRNTSPVPNIASTADEVKAARAEPDIVVGDDVISLIENETPPDYVKPTSSPPSIENAPASFQLIASYGDDSDTEESLRSIKKSDTGPRPLFPSAVASEEATTKPLFPSAVFVSEQTPQVSSLSQPTSTDASSTKSLLLDELPDSTTTHKAFRRKKRIDFATEMSLPSTSRAEPVFATTAVTEPVVPMAPVTETNHRYNMDPSSHEHRGFGFGAQTEASSKKNSGIQFIKAETINFQPASVAKPVESPSDFDGSIEDLEKLADRADLLREKLDFLGVEGKEGVSPVQIMAIQLETLVLAWLGGALTPTYLSQWLTGRAEELSEKERSAAPVGWTCIWDRKVKRYCYKNKETGIVLWDYPEIVPEEVPISNHLLPENPNEEVEMELSTTPPHVSPDPIARDPTPPPPPVISMRSATPPPPPPPVITKEENVKKALNQVSSTSEGKKQKVLRPPEPEEPPPPGVEDSVVNFVPPLPPRLVQPSPPDSSSQSPLVASRPGTSNSAPEVSTSQKSTRKRNLISELDSFYSDIAKLEVELGSVTSSEAVAPPPPSVSPPPLPPPPPPPSTSDQPPRKKKKQVKVVGSGLKKKGVPSLVAKWQQVQQEARRNCSDDGSDDDDDVSSTH